MEYFYKSLPSGSSSSIRYISGRIALCITLLLVLCTHQDVVGQSTQIFSQKSISSHHKEAIKKSLGVKSAAFFDINLQSLRDGSLQSGIPITLADGERIFLQIQEIGKDDKPILVTMASGNRYFMKHRRFNGKVEGQSHSMVSISLFDDYLMGTFVYQGKNYNIEPYQSKSTQESYIIYDSDDVLSSSVFNCASETIEGIQEDALPDIDLPAGSAEIRSMPASIPIFLECDYKLYQDKGGNTASYVTGLFDVVAGIYEDAGVTINISEIYIWDSADPYGATSSGASSGAVLDAFECHRTSYNGRLAHLLSTSNQNLGGIAARPSCPSSGEYTSAIYGFSNIGNSYSSNLNNYSWSVNVLAHELGHNMSSPHTHSCSWNNNNTQIDACGSGGSWDCGTSNSTGNPPIPPNGSGTIMSYCHVGGTGIDLAQGFHSQVRTKMQEFANCISSEICGAPAPSNLYATNVSGATATLHCAIPNMVYYYWGWRIVGSGQNGWDYDGASSGSLSVTGLSSGQTYEFVCAVYCDIGWSSFSCIVPMVNGSAGCPEELEVDGVPITDPMYEANNMIMSSGRVANGSSVMFDAINEIVLEPNFEVQLGATFEASPNDGCGN